MSKGYSGQNLEANQIRKREASHDFRAMIKASALVAQEQGFTDAWSVLNALADDISVAKKLKAVLNSKSQGTRPFKRPQLSTAFFFLCLFT